MAADVPQEGNWARAGFAPGTVVAGYLLEAQIGAGGMAVVFRARDESLYRTVALKILAPALAWDEEFRERFIRESRAAAGVEHPHIIPVYAAGNADNVLYIAMRLVTGGDLSSVVRRDGPFAAGRAASFIAGIASALDTAHRSGLVHRDIKPGNILIDAVPGQPDHVYLADFGLSKGMLSTGLTGKGGFLGTPDYCSPEQITGKGIDGRTDQYALACVAYTLLAGRPPFRRDEPMAILLAHTADPPPSVVALRPDLPAAVDEVIARGLAKSPADRYGSCGEFAAALRLALEGGAQRGAVPDGAARSAGPPSTLETQSVPGPSPVPGRQPDGLSGVPGFPVGDLDASRPERTGNPVAPGSASGPANLAEPPDQRESAGAFDTTRVFSTLEPAGQATPASLEPEPATDPFARPRPRRRVSRRVAVASVSAVAVLAAGAITAALLASSGRNSPTMLAAQHPTPPFSATTLSTTTPASAHIAPAVLGSLKDSRSGLAYSRLGTPWANGCPPGLSSRRALSWTAGESAPAGQLTANSQRRVWPGEACSALLPAQYGYKGVPTLASIAQKLATAFAAAYYSGLGHTFTRLASTAHPVSGRHGWEVTYRLDYRGAASAGLSFTSEEAAVVVIDRGSGLPPAVFFASVPSDLGTAEVNALVRSLSLTLPKSPPHPSASASTTTGGTGNNNGNSPQPTYPQPTHPQPTSPKPAPPPTTCSSCSCGSCPPTTPPPPPATTSPPPTF